MLVELFLTHQSINPVALKGKACIVIDTLRASSTIM